MYALCWHMRSNLLLHLVLGIARHSRSLVKTLPNKLIKTTFVYNSVNWSAVSPHCVSFPQSICNTVLYSVAHHTRVTVSVNSDTAAYMSARIQLHFIKHSRKLQRGKSLCSTVFPGLNMYCCSSQTPCALQLSGMCVQQANTRNLLTRWNIKSPRVIQMKAVKMRENKHIVCAVGTGS